MAASYKVIHFPNWMVSRKGTMFTGISLRFPASRQTGFASLRETK
jgi:hypothetical protein